MIKLLYIQIPEIVEREKLCTRLQDFVSIECYSEAVRYKNKEVSLRHLLGATLVSFALWKYWNLSIENCRISRGIKGKPFVVGHKNIFFNISHSGKYVVCAVSDREVGIDIEKRAKARMEVAGRFFHEQEVAMLKSLSGTEQDRLFFNYWAVKESFLKCIGTGLTRPLNTFIVKFTGIKIVLCEERNVLPLCVSVCPVDPDYACYVCGESEKISVIQEVTFEEITCY